jgi:hypothetical protein
METKFTIFFENPFWVGVLEKYEDSQYQTAKIVFGSEPTDAEIHDFMLNKYYLFQLSQPVVTEKKEVLTLNHKRQQREVKKELNKKGIGTKAQNAVKEMYEQKKIEINKLTRARKDEIEKEKFELKQIKKKKKKSGH